MINNLSVTAVIPVRGGSRRVPGKNIRKFGNSSLLVNKIRQLKQVELIDRIVVTSDSEVMLQAAAAEGTVTHRRPLEYCDDKTRSFNEVVEYVASNVEGDILMWTPCTCPMLMPESYRIALDSFADKVAGSGEYDSVVSCRMLKEYVFDEKGPINFNPVRHCISQNLPDWKVLTNGYYISMREDMVRWKYFYGKKPLLIPVDKISAIDIDDMEDFEIAEMIFNSRNMKDTADAVAETD